MPKDRLEAFSDGVFAIAITLLVLDIAIPDPGPGSLAHALAEQWPVYAAYVVSFATIGIIWINHHAVMAHMIRADRGVLLLNLLLLGWVSLIPWPTGLTAEYMRVGGNDERVAAIVYAGVMAGMGLTFGAMWRYATTDAGSSEATSPTTSCGAARVGSPPADRSTSWPWRSPSSVRRQALL